MTSKFQTALLIGIAILVGMLYMRRPEKQIPIVQDIQVTQPEERSITVSSEGKFEAKLDTAEFTIIIEAEEMKLEDAKTKSEQAYEDLKSFLRDHGIEEKDIIDSYLQVQEKTGYTTAVNQKPYGVYLARRIVKVVVHDLEELEPLFIELQEAGYYQIEDIVIRLSHMDDVRDRALQLAMEEAQKRAKAIARAINREIGQAISIDTLEANSSESSYEFTYDTLDTFFGKNTSGWRKPYYGPEIIIVAHVTVKYELK